MTVVEVPAVHRAGWYSGRFPNTTAGSVRPGERLGCPLSRSCAAYNAVKITWIGTDGYEQEKSAFFDPIAPR